MNARIIGFIPNTTSRIRASPANTLHTHTFLIFHLYNTYNFIEKHDRNPMIAQGKHAVALKGMVHCAGVRSCFTPALSTTLSVALTGNPHAGLEAVNVGLPGPK